MCKDCKYYASEIEAWKEKVKQYEKSYKDLHRTAKLNEERIIKLESENNRLDKLLDYKCDRCIKGERLKVTKRIIKEVNDVFDKIVKGHKE